jgi:hypothetical protein
MPHYDEHREYFQQAAPIDDPIGEAIEAARAEEDARARFSIYLAGECRDFAKLYGVGALLRVVGDALSGQPELFK